MSPHEKEKRDLCAQALLHLIKDPQKVLVELEVSPQANNNFNGQLLLWRRTSKSWMISLDKEFAKGFRPNKFVVFDFTLKWETQLKYYFLVCRLNG